MSESLAGYYSHEWLLNVQLLAWCLQHSVDLSVRCNRLQQLARFFYGKLNWWRNFVIYFILESQKIVLKTSKLQEPFQENTVLVQAPIFDLQLYKEVCEFLPNIIVNLLFELM